MSSAPSSSRPAHRGAASLHAAEAMRPATRLALLAAVLISFAAAGIATGAVAQHAAPMSQAARTR